MIISLALKDPQFYNTNEMQSQMKKLLILGAGMAGTLMVNKLFRQLDKNEWEITLVDKDENHYYQPGFLFIPFGIYEPEDVVKPKK